MSSPVNPGGNDPAAGIPLPGLIRSTSVVGSMTLLSRVLGLVRDVVLSRWFGAGPVMDAFFVAFRIPNLLRRFFAEGAFAQAFVPVIAEYRETRSLAEVRELIARAAGSLALVLLALSVLGIVAAPILISVFATGFVDDREAFALASAMLRLTFPYILFISLTALAGSVLNAFGRFAVPAFTPVLLNLVLIAAAAWLAPNFAEPAMALAWGVFLAGLVQLAFQLPFLFRAGLLPLPRWGAAHEGVRRIVRLMLPAIFGSSVAQISILFNTWVASFLAAGSVSWLYYSDRLVEFPLGVFGIALATVILPRLSAQHTNASPDEFSRTLDWALKLVLVIGVPAALGLMLLAEPMLTAMFLGGAFGLEDVQMASASLRAFAPGLLGFILVKVLAPGFFARQDTRTPVRIGVRALLIGMGLNIVFVLTLIATGWAPPHAGLAAATSAAALLNSTLLFMALRRERVYLPGRGWTVLAIRVAVASIAMTVFLFVFEARMVELAAIGKWSQVGLLGLAVAGGALAYFAAAAAAGLRPRDLSLR